MPPTLSPQQIDWLVKLGVPPGKIGNTTPPEIGGDDVDAAFDNNLSTGDLHQLPGQNPAQAFAEQQLEAAMDKKAALKAAGDKAGAKAQNQAVQDAQEALKDAKEGLQKVKIKSDPAKDIAHHDNMEFDRIKTPGADQPVNDVEVRTHSANPNAPEDSFSHDNPTTQIHTEDGEYRIPDPNADPNQPDPGTYKKLGDMTDAEKADAHSPAARKGAPRIPDDEPNAVDPKAVDPEAGPSDPSPPPVADKGASSARVTEADASPASVPDAETPPVEVPSPTPIPAGNTAATAAETATTGAESSSGAEAGAAGGSASGAGLLAGAITAGMTLVTDVGKVGRGEMSATDAAVDVGEKSVGAGLLTAGGATVAKSIASTTAGAGGVIGAVVGTGLALIDDVGKVEDGTMTAGHATADVGTKGAIGAAAGALGAMAGGAVAGSELGAALGTIVPGAGNVIGFVAGAAVGAAVGLVGTALAETETGQKVEAAVGGAVDAGISAVKDAGHAIANFFGGDGDDPPGPAPASKAAPSGQQPDPAPAPVSAPQAADAGVPDAAPTG